MDLDKTITFIIVGELFERYTIVVNTATKSTSVYCEECGKWVAKYDGDQLSTHSSEQLLDKIVSDHREQVMGNNVSFDDSESFL
jgi:hypothetical protein